MGTIRPDSRGCNDIEVSGDVFKDGMAKIDKDIQSDEFQYLANPKKGFEDSIKEAFHLKGDTGMSWLSQLFGDLFAAFHGGQLWRQIAACGEAILKAVLGGVGADLNSVALQAVAAAEAKGGGGTDKFAYAYQYIVNTFKDKTFDKTLLNHAIENAVLAMKAQNPNAVWVQDVATLGTTTPTT